MRQYIPGSFKLTDRHWLFPLMIADTSCRSISIMGLTELKSTTLKGQC